MKTLIGKSLLDTAIEGQVQVRNHLIQTVKVNEATKLNAVLKQLGSPIVCGNQKSNPVPDKDNAGPKSEPKLK